MAFKCNKIKAGSEGEISNFFLEDLQKIVGFKNLSFQLNDFLNFKGERFVLLLNNLLND